jgi:hypothetical protein
LKNVHLKKIFPHATNTAPGASRREEAPALTELDEVASSKGVKVMRADAGGGYGVDVVGGAN